MTEESQGAHADAPEISAEQQLRNLLAGDTPAQSPDPGATGEQENEKPTEETPQPETTEDKAPAGEGPDAETEEQETESLLPIDLDSLTEDQLAELAKKLNSGAIERFGEMTRKRREAEERLRALQEQREDDLIPGTEEPKDNPYRDITDKAELAKAAQNLRGTIEQLEETLDDNEGLMPDDDIEFNGQTYPKKQLKKYLRDARRAEREYLPAQARKIRGMETAEAQRATMEAHMRQELKWFGSEEKSEAKALFDNWMSNAAKELEAIKDVAPQLWATAPGFIALAAEAKTRKSAAKPAAKAEIPGPKPPSNPAGAGTTSDKADMAAQSKLAAAAKRFHEGGGRARDFETFLTEQMKTT